MAYSMALRDRVVVAVVGGQPIVGVSRRFRVARSTVHHRCDRRRRGELEPRVPGAKRSVKPAAGDEQWMRGAVAAKPGITAKQLMGLLSVAVAESTVCRALRRLGLSLKKSR